MKKTATKLSPFSRKRNASMMMNLGRRIEIENLEEVDDDNDCFFTKSNFFIREIKLNRWGLYISDLKKSWREAQHIRTVSFFFV